MTNSNVRKMKISLILLLSLATVLHPAQAKPIDRHSSIFPYRWALKFEYDVLPPGRGWGSPGWRNRRRQELARRRNIINIINKRRFLKTSAEKAIKDHVVEVQFKILFSIVGIMPVLAIIVCLILVYKQKRKSTDSQTIDV